MGDKMNKREEKRLKKVRQMEAELAFAPPDKAAALTVKLVRLKSRVFDKGDGRL